MSAPLLDLTIGRALEMAATGQSRHFGRRPTTSGLPQETDIVGAGGHVLKVPQADYPLATSDVLVKAALDIDLV